MPPSQLESERDEAKRRKEFCEQWYAERFQAIHAYGKAAGEPIFSDLCSLMANGTLSGARLSRGEHPFVYDPPTYAQILNIAKHEREEFRWSLARLLDASHGTATQVLEAQEHARTLLNRK